MGHDKKVKSKLQNILSIRALEIINNVVFLYHFNYNFLLYMAINRHSSFRASSDRAQLSSATWISNMLNGLHKRVKYQDPTIGQPNHDS